jgi:hypothetical protein
MQGIRWNNAEKAEFPIGNGQTTNGGNKIPGGCRPEALKIMEPSLNGGIPGQKTVCSQSKNEYIVTPYG